MNVLILTPDAVGSTLLQRLITIYMQFHWFDRPVINLHELTNGLELYYNERLGRDVLGKPENERWGYHQSLETVVQLLESADHYKTSRLAQYHLKNRQDPISDQRSFYSYLNNNFLIIACRRRNLLEHAISWAISKITKKLNVYTASEKIESFQAMYKNPIDLDPASVIDSLNQYQDYIAWAADNFHIASYFNYETDLPRIEEYILSLPMFQTGQQRTWKSMFQIEFDDWNRCHYSNSDLSSHLLNAPESAKTDLITVGTYQQTNHYLDRMVNQRTMITPPPIKKQTLLEKIYIVKNFQACLDAYNDWAVARPDLADTITISQLRTQVLQEMQYWRPGENLSGAAEQLIGQQPAQLKYQNDADL